MTMTRSKNVGTGSKSVVVDAVNSDDQVVESDDLQLENQESSGSDDSGSREKPTYSTIIDNKNDPIPFPPVSVEDISYGRGVKGSPKVTIPTHRVLINPTDHSVYSVVTKDYLMVKHEDLITMAEETIAEFADYGEWDRRIQFGGGGRMRLEYKWPEVRHEISTSDYLNPSLTFFNSYDGGWALKAYFGAFRPICSNGAVIGEKKVSYRKEHHQIGENLDNLAEVIAVGMNSYREHVGMWKEWTNQLVDAPTTTAVVKQLGMTPGQVSRLMEEPEIHTGIQLVNLVGREEKKDKNGRVVIEGVEPTLNTITMWELFNTVTQFLTHGVESMSKRKRLEERARVVFK